MRGIKRREGQGEREGKLEQERRKKNRREKKKRERKEGRKEMRRGTETNVAQGVELDDKGPGTALREVGFLLFWLFYA